MKKTNENENEIEKDDIEIGNYIASLFINTSYAAQTILIPYFKQVNDERNEKEEQQQKLQYSDSTEMMKINLSCSNSACTDYDLTGQIIWPVSVLLGHFIASRKGQELVSGKNVIELGAGCGLPGLVAAHFAKNVLITDGNDTVVDLMKDNCKNFRTTDAIDKNVKEHKLHASKLIWGNKDDLTNVLESHGKPSFDIVLAADVVQWPAVVEPLLHTIKALLWNNRISLSSSSDDNKKNNKNQSTHYQSYPKCILGIVQRAQSTSQMFFKLAKESGFQCNKVPFDSFLKEGVIPATCREYGGRETEIFELTLQDFSVSPILLDMIHKKKNNNGKKDLVVLKDTTLGDSFQNTLYLPY